MVTENEKKQKIEELKQELRDLCKTLGCSKLSKNCPGDPYCGILRKIIL